MYRTIKLKFRQVLGVSTLFVLQRGEITQGRQSFYLFRTAMQVTESAVVPDSVSGVAALEKASALMGAEVHFTLIDARVLVGRLHCIDWMSNVILRDAEIWKSNAAMEEKRIRRIFPFVCVKLADVSSAVVCDPANA